MPKTQRRGYRKCASEQREVSSGAQEVPQVSHFSAAWRSSRSQKADTVVHRYAHSALDAEPPGPQQDHGEV